MNYTLELLRSSFIEDWRQVLPRHRGRKWTVRPPGKLKGLVLHQSLEEKGSALSVASYHVGSNHISEAGLPGLSYTLFIERDGRVVMANDVEAKTWSQGYHDPDWVDENALYMGVCVGGNFSGPGYKGTQRPTREQIDSVDKLWKICKSLWGWTDAGLFGHFHFGKSACPGGDLLEYIYSYRPAQFISVMDKQVAMSRLGCYNGRVDGAWGPESKAALVSFQRTAGMKPDGIWGPLTTAVVFSKLSRAQ